MNWRQRAAGWKNRNKPVTAPETASKPVVEQEEVESMEDAAEALERPQRRLQRSAAPDARKPRRSSDEEPLSKNG